MARRSVAGSLLLPSGRKQRPRLLRRRRPKQRPRAEEAGIRGVKGSNELDPDYRRRLMLFVMLDAAAVLFILVPGLIYLFVLDNGLSEQELMLYVVGLLAVQAAIIGFPLWKFGILHGPQAGKRDAR